MPVTGASSNFYRGRKAERQAREKWQRRQANGDLKRRLDRLNSSHYDRSRSAIASRRLGYELELWPFLAVIERLPKQRVIQAGLYSLRRMARTVSVSGMSASRVFLMTLPGITHRPCYGTCGNWRVNMLERLLSSWRARR
jgi:hypothetical protein